MQKPFVPSFASELDPRIRQLHSNDYRNLSQLQEGSVLVVGASHSGADIAYEAAVDHETILAGPDTGQIPASVETRRGRAAFRVLFFLGSHVLTMDTPLGRKMRPHVRHGGAPLLRYRKKDLLAAGVERVHARIVGVQDGLPVLDDGRVLDVQNVIWCTGFRRDFSWIQVPFEVGEDGYPVQYRGAVESSPGLYFVGLLFLHSFTSMLIGGTGRDAERVAKHIAPGPREQKRLPRLSLRSPSRSPRDEAPQREPRSPRTPARLDPRLERPGDDDTTDRRREAKLGSRRRRSFTRARSRGKRLRGTEGTLGCRSDATSLGANPRLATGSVGGRRSQGRTVVVTLRISARRNRRPVGVGKRSRTFPGECA